MYQGMNQELVEDDCDNVIYLSTSSHIPAIRVSTLHILSDSLRAWPVLGAVGAEKSHLWGRGLPSSCIEPYKDQ